MSDRNRKLIVDVKSDGYDYAVKFIYSRTCYQAAKSFTMTKDGRLCVWGKYILKGTGTDIDMYWRILGYPLEAQLDLFFDKLVLALAEEGKQPGMTADDWRAMLLEAKNNPIVGLLTRGVRCEIRQLDNFGVLFTGEYHKGLSMLIKDRIGTTYHHEIDQWEVAFVSTLGLKDEIMERLGFQDEQVVVIPGIYRVSTDAEGREKLDELTDCEREDWEVTLRRRGGLFDDVSIIDEIEAIEQEGAIATDDELAEIEPAELSERERLFLDITQRMKLIDVDEADFKAFRKQPEKNCAKNLPRFKKFLPTQITGMEFLVRRSSGLLADDMGMGKTVCAVVAAAYLAKKKSKKIVVVTNIAALETTWETTIAAAFPSDKIAMCVWEEDADWIVLNYEKLNILEARGDDVEVVIFDEAHKVCCPESMRTQRAFALSHVVPVRFLVTGTPILNTPLDLHTLLRLSGHPIGEIGVRKYMTLMEDEDFKTQIHAVLRTGWLIRRMKSDWLKLKPKKRVFKRVQMSAKQEKAFKKMLVRQPGRGAASVQMHSMRAYLAEIKLRDMFAWFATLNKDDKVIVFCEYKSSVHDLQALCDQAGYSFVTIYGQTNQKDRSLAQAQFESDETCRMFIGTSKAAGESITLVAANYVYFLTLPWTHGGLVQAEDRAWRNGQLREVNVIIPLVDKTIDDRQWAIIEGKEEMSSDLFTATVEDEKHNMESIMKIVLQGGEDDALGKVF